MAGENRYAKISEYTLERAVKSSIGADSVINVRVHVMNDMN